MENVEQAAERRERERAEIVAMVERVRDFLGDAPDDLPFSRTVRDPTPWGTMEESVEETSLTSADLRAMCDVVELLNEQADALLAERDRLREDRARLDWLEQNMTDWTYSAEITPELLVDVDGHTCPTLREAIDHAARAKESR